MPLNRRQLITRAAALAAVPGLATPAIAQAPVRVRLMMDWAWQAGQSFALVAFYRGFFREEGIDIQLDRGFGSGRVPVEIAGGNYQMGFGDFGAAVRFVGQRPETGIFSCGIMFHSAAHAVVVRADSAIRAPRDLEGKTLAAPEVDAGRQMFPAFARANGIDVSKVNFQTVSGELREPMLAQRRVDGITGFLNTSQVALERLGLPAAQQRAFRYREFGVPLYASCLLTTRRFAEQNPAAVRGVTRAMFRGLAAAVRNPDETIATLARHEPLTDVPLERGRWDVTLRELIDTPEVRAGGLNNVDMARVQQSIAFVEDSFGMPRRLTARDMYATDFLPPREDGMLFG
jgi:NitT/TauT family transport system substrate-binding protein